MLGDSGQCNNDPICDIVLLTANRLQQAHNELSA